MHIEKVFLSPCKFMKYYLYPGVHSVLKELVLTILENRKYRSQFQITTHPVKTSALTYLSNSPTPFTQTSTAAVLRPQRKLAMNKTFWNSGEIR